MELKVTLKNMCLIIRVLEINVILCLKVNRDANFKLFSMVEDISMDFKFCFSSTYNWF